MLTSSIVFVTSFVAACHAVAWGHVDRSKDRCEAVIEETILDDRSTSVDDTPSRLHSTWLSQECEVRAGPEYVIRKYTFYENGTFLLLRHHYAEESCSVATHTVTARGSIKLLSQPSQISGTTEAKFHLDSVHIIPLNRQVAHKFGHRLNVTCEPQPRWRPYVAQLVYEQPSRRFANPHWYGSRHNSHQSQLLTPGRQSGIDCLEPLGIEFGELRLLRVQKKPSSSRSLGVPFSHTPRIELFLGSLPQNTRSKWIHKPTSLQHTILVRSDTINGCPICGRVLRGTEYNPPLLHEVAPLPALLGGFWLSMSCESVTGGLWSRRQFQIFSGDRLWSGRWDYFEDPKCLNFLYSITAAGSYVQRAGRQRRHEMDMNFDSQYDKFDRLDDSDSDIFSKRSLEVFNLKTDEEETGEDQKNKDQLLQKDPKMLLDSSSKDFGSDPSEKVVSKFSTTETSSLGFEGRSKNIEIDTKNIENIETLRVDTEQSIPEEIRESVEEKSIEQSESLEKLTDSFDNHLSTDRSESDLEMTTSKKNLLNLKPDRKKYLEEMILSKRDDQPRPRKSKFTSAIPKLLKDIDIFSLRTWKVSKKAVDTESIIKKVRRSLEEGTYRHLLEKTQPSLAASYAAMLRGNQPQEETTKRPSLVATTPFGTTELDLHVAESVLIPGNYIIANRCGGKKDEPLNFWPRNCVPRFIEAPSTLGMKARIGVSWTGQYILSLGPRDDDLWDPPIRQCGQISEFNPALRAHLRRSLGLRYGLYSSADSNFKLPYNLEYVLYQHIILCIILIILR